MLRASETSTEKMFYGLYTLNSYREAFMSDIRKMSKNEKKIRRYIFARKLVTKVSMILIFIIPIILLVLLLVGGLELIKALFFPFVPIITCAILIPLALIAKTIGRYCPFCYKKFHVVDAFQVSFPKKCNLCGEELSKESKYYNE